MTEICLDNISDQIYDAGMLDDQEAQVAALERVIRSLENQNEMDGEILYLLGYAYYLHPVKSESQKLSVIKNLTAVSESSASKYTFQLANLYLGYCYFDDNEYATALSLFEKVDVGCFDDYWTLKVLEVIFLSAAFTSSLNSALYLFDEFMKLAETMEEEEIFPMSLLHLLDTLESNISDLDPDTFKSIVDKLRAIIPWASVLKEK